MMTTRKGERAPRWHELSIGGGGRHQSVGFPLSLACPAMVSQSVTPRVVVRAESLHKVTMHGK
ncbi:hypothetical protein SAMN05444166_5599 [Singulisphaera sp. GP187]|nr:hypothetical protein SAMN05444166_5599 [Singulisphaera sp. GP187]